MPRGNGQVERMHSTIISVLTKLSINDPETWFQHTVKVQQFMNKTYQRAIDTTPSELLFGVPLRTKDDLRIKELISQEVASSFSDLREEQRAKAKSQILKVQQENKKNFNAKREKTHQYKVGDQVAIKRTQFGAGFKLKKKNFGPHEVTQVKGNDRYGIQKIGIHEGPHQSSSLAEYMIP